MVLNMDAIELLAERVLELPVQERLLLVNRILSSIESAEDPEAQEEWEREIRRRIESYDVGASATISGAEVFAVLEEKLRR